MARTSILLLVIFLSISPVHSSSLKSWQEISLNAKETLMERNHFESTFGKAMLERLLQQVQPTKGPTAEEQAALYFFRKEAGYFEVNAYLRGAKSTNYTPRGLLAIARLIASGLNKLPKEKTHTGDVYRGTHLTNEQISKQYKVDKVITEKAFTSCCVDKSVAAIYARGAKQVGKSQVLFVIKSATGKRVSEGLTGEVLFLPGSQFKVVANEVDEWKRVVITLQEVTK